MPGSAFPQASPESQGISSEGILRFIEAVESTVHEFHSFMLLRHGFVVAEGWWSPYRKEFIHDMFSLSKSFTSTAIGLAVGEGLLSVDDFVISFFPDELPDEPSDNLKAMRVKHLLSMSSGHDADTMQFMFGRPDNNWVKGFLATPVTHEPGSHFVYNTGATYTLAALLHRLTHQSLLEYLQPRLFEPLGIEGAYWESCPRGINVGGFGLSIKTEDIARLGQLYLQNGRWGEKQILSPEWVEAATSFQVSNGDAPESDWEQGYGYQFWRCRHNFYRGDGAFGQYCVVMPEKDAVLAITGGTADMQVPLNLVWDILLPAIQNEALPEDPFNYEKLKTKLASLNIPPVAGLPASPIAGKISGKVYLLDKNELKIESIRFDFGEAARLLIKTAGPDADILATYGSWQAGETSLFSGLAFMDSHKIVASAAWLSDTVFKLDIRLYETPFFHEIIFSFGGEELLLETSINVSFEPVKRLQMRGRLM